ncbi:MAG: aminoglycoside phosphotransferase [Alphaproteobacteria bacterium HGW-Alphaproteobacteria-6]|nr:MAG: aminoglycoside phosphotransferase [Alphaproteobacteria bacterium HGW-Alphaproteobacteria-6]
MAKDGEADGSALRLALALVGLTARPEPMADTGLAHSHFRLPGTGLIARIPKQSQMRLGAAENLAYQAACYRRAAPSGHAPRLQHLLAPSAGLPRGGLVVSEIIGRPARLPDDLDAIVDALAAIHRLALPAPADRAPLLAPADPLHDLLAEIAAQATHLDGAGVAPVTRAIIAEGLAGLRRLAAGKARPARRLISFDAHPGNFLIDAQGRAILVDLEKCRYSAPQLDLAHATLYTSTTWDVASHAVLDAGQVEAAHRRWLAGIGGDDDARSRAAAWLVPMRRAMWLWSLTWCAKWRVLSAGAARNDGRGEDWSAAGSDAALVAHVRDRVDHYLKPSTARRVDDGLRALAGRLPMP